MRKICEICGSAFEATRSDARYCSVRCRKVSSRMGKAGIPIVLKREEVERAAIRSAHDAASDLSRASQLAPAPRCIVYREIAETIEDRLGGLGL